MSEFEAVVARILTADTGKDREEATEQLRGLMGSTRKRDQRRGAEAEARQLLLELGMPDHIKGHRYVLTAICMTVGDFELVSSITKVLYPTVAGKFGATPAQVERAIRHAIEVTWVRGDASVVEKYFGNTVSACKGKPTNGEFIARCANVIRQRIRK